MIEIIGPRDREEHRYALKLADDMVALWPDLEESEDQVRIAASAKVFGGRVQDIDIIILAQLAGRRIRPRRPIGIEGPNGPLGPYAGEVSVRNLFLTIEVNGHDQGGVRFDGLNAIVRYGSGEKSATDQAMDQMNALRGYTARMAGVHPFVIHLVALENVSSSALPPRPHNIISGDQSFASLITAICELKPPWQGSGRPTLSCCSDEIAEKVAQLPIFRPLQPTALDRKRMERLSASSSQIEAIEPRLGKVQLILRGHGGAGKTSILLQLAKRAYDEDAARSLILTYNQALAADIRRLMTLASVPTTDDAGGIRIETVMSFVNRVGRRLGIFAEEDDPLERYEERSEELAQLLETGAITGDDIRRLTNLHPEELRFDHVMIDEGQDWPRGEIAIMRWVYGSERLVIADGIDQLVRGTVADWRAGASTSETIRLRRSLRMKANLARFANAVAEELGAPGWKVQPNPAALGGRVIVVEGPLGNEIELHRELMGSLRSAGNAPIDCLYCVPPSMVRRGVGAERESMIASMLRANGERCWDGASADVRRDIPRDIDAARIVQYQSCRGLEGWTVVAAALDELWEGQHEIGHATGAQLVSSSEEARTRAARWTMIPLSRAMDTLVVNVRSAESDLGRVLKTVADRMSDVVEWRN
jgi:GTPase SAR1 family protein